MRVRVINKTRFYTFVAVVLMTIAFMFVVAIAIANDIPNIVGYNTYVVSNGDTLWEIAEMSNGYGKVAQEQIVYDIRDASNITPNIQLGDRVQIPIYEED